MNALVVARFELIRRIRNRSALFTAFIGPLSLAVVFSLLIGGAGAASWTIGVVDEDGSATTAGIVAALTDPDDAAAPDDGDAVTFVVLAADRATGAVDDGDVDAALVLPAGYGAGTAAASGPPPLRVLQDPDRPIAGLIAQSVAGAIGRQGRVVALASATVLTAAPTRDPAAVVNGLLAATPAIATEDATIVDGEVSVGAYYGASMAVLFLFFTIGLAARSLVAERRSGTLARMLATPTRLPAVIAGKTLAVSVLGLAGFVTTWAVTTFGFGARWGSPAAVAALMVATVVAVGGVAMFVASLARTDQQADTYTSMVAFLLALLGGNFIQPGTAPDALANVARLTPNGWALDAFTAVSVDGEALADVLPTLAVLGLMGALFGAAGTLLLLRRSAP